MSGIYVAAIITTVLVLALIGGVLLRRAPAEERWLLLTLIVLELPMCALAFHGVRMPLDAWLRGQLARDSAFYQALTVLYAPVTEEPAKLWVLLIPAIVRRLTPENFVRVAVAIGLGFGIGEAWLLASLIADKPRIAALPWYQLGGFMGERFMVCLTHGAFTGLALRYIVVRRSVLKGLAGAMGLHWLGNFPILLARHDWGGFGKAGWQAILGLWLLFYFMALMALLAWLAFGRVQLGRLFFGEAQCPECAAIYPRPLWAVNLFPRRYERCPACKRWHLTRRLRTEPRDFPK